MGQHPHGPVDNVIIIILFQPDSYSLKINIQNPKQKSTTLTWYWGSLFCPTHQNHPGDIVNVHDPKNGLQTKSFMASS